MKRDAKVWWPAFISLGLLLSGAFPSSAVAAEFHWCNPQPVGNQIMDIDYLDETTAYAVGYMGALIRSDDGGLTWTNLSDFAAFPFHMTSLAILGPDSLLVAGGDASLYRWVAGDWTPLLSESGPRIYNVQRVAGDFFCAIGGESPGDSYVFRSYDGGQTWTSQTIPSAEYFLRDQHWFSATEGLVVGDTGSWWTDDGGDTWHPMAGIDTPSFQARMLAFEDDLQGILGGVLFPSIPLSYVTSDGGRSWEPAYEWPYGIPIEAVALGSGHYIMSQTETIFMESTDGGWTWNSMTNMAYFYEIWAMELRSDGFLMTGGVCGQLAYTSDGGASWGHADQHFGFPQAWGFHDLDRGSSTRVFASATIVPSQTDSIIVRSQDAGYTWEALTLPTRKPGALEFFDDNYGIVAGGEAGQISYLDTLAVTQDGGGTWAKVHIDPGYPAGYGRKFYVNDFAFTPDGATVYAAMGRIDPEILGTVMRSDDFGLTWALSDAGLMLDVEFVCIQFLSALDGYVVDTLGALYRTSDGGATWVELDPLDGEQPVEDMHWFDCQTGLIARSRYTPWDPYGIWHTADGGQTWDHVIFDGVYSLDFIGTKHGVAMKQPTADGSFILVTKDAGVSWDEHQLPLDVGGSVSTDIWWGGIDAVLQPDGVVFCGRCSALMRLRGEDIVTAAPSAETFSTGRLDAPLHVGSRFPLSFALDRSARAELRIYDVSGRLVAELASGRFDGHQEVTRVWTGEDSRGKQAASGVYFARLRIDEKEAGSTKLILLR